MEELKVPIYSKVTEELKAKTKKQAIDLKIEYQEYISIALEHFADHVEKDELNFKDSRFNG